MKRRPLSRHPWLRLGLLPLWLIAFQHCKDAHPSNQVMLVLDAPGNLRSHIAAVEIAVAGRDPQQLVFGPLRKHRLAVSAADWPIEVVLRPEQANHPRRYRVTAAALGPQGDLLTRVAAVGDYRPGQLATVQLLLDQRCLVDAVLCAEAQTCSAGRCENLPDPLPTAAPTTEAAGADPQSPTPTPSPVTSGKSGTPAQGPAVRPPAGACDDCPADTRCTVTAAGEARCEECSGTRDRSAACGLALTHLTLEGATLTPTFRAEQSDYITELPLLERSLQLTAKTTDASTLVINGQPHPSGQPITLQPLPVGRSEVQIQVANAAGEAAQYQLVVMRGGQAPVDILPANPDAGDNFGRAVAMDDDTVAISALYEDGSATGGWPLPEDNAVVDSGAVYLFERDGTGALRATAYLKPEDVAANIYFGASLALDGDTLLVGALLGHGEVKGAGAVYVFVRDHAGWHQQAKLVPDDATFGDWFGAALSLTGDTALIGAPDRLDGAVYVYHRTGEHWSLTQRLTDGTPGKTLTRFGAALCLQSNTLIVGAPEASRAGEQAGAVHVFSQVAEEPWREVQRLEPDALRSGDWFGYALACQPGRLAVGAPHADDDALDVGKVFIFEQDSVEWVQHETLLPESGGAYALFGSALALSGNASLLVGAPGESDGGGGLRQPSVDTQRPASGAVHVFARHAEGFELETYIKATVPGTGDSFGQALAVSNRTLIVGAISRNGESTSMLPTAQNAEQDIPPAASGAAYLFQ